MGIDALHAGARSRSRRSRRRWETPTTL